jgi:Flp pilus assembly protein TadD
MLLGDPGAAIPDFAQVRQRSPNDPFLIQTKNGLAWAHFLTGRHDEALSSAGTVLQEDPVYKPALRVTAATQARVGMRREALAAVTHLGQVDPTSASARSAGR